MKHGDDKKKDGKELVWVELVEIKKGTELVEIKRESEIVQNREITRQNIMKEFIPAIIGGNSMRKKDTDKGSEEKKSDSGKSVSAGRMRGLSLDFWGRSDMPEDFTSDGSGRLPLINSADISAIEEVQGVCDVDETFYECKDLLFGFWQKNEDARSIRNRNFLAKYGTVISAPLMKALLQTAHDHNGIFAVYDDAMDLVKAKKCAKLRKYLNDSLKCSYNVGSIVLNVTPERNIDLVDCTKLKEDKLKKFYFLTYCNLLSCLHNTPRDTYLCEERLLKKEGEFWPYGLQPKWGAGARLSLYSVDVLQFISKKWTLSAFGFYENDEHSNLKEAQFGRKSSDFLAEGYRDFTPRKEVFGEFKKIMHQSFVARLVQSEEVGSKKKCNL